VVADLTGTTFRDPSGEREIRHARQYALMTRSDMRLVTPPGPLGAGLDAGRHANVRALFASVVSSKSSR
jgi:hypothetical protein